MGLRDILLICIVYLLIINGIVLILLRYIVLVLTWHLLVCVGFLVELLFVVIWFLNLDGIVAGLLV